MMPAVITRNMATTSQNLMLTYPLVEVLSTTNWEGIWLTMLTKMISDIPLPMPRCEISSPSHMMKAVPAVSVITMINTLPGV